MDTTAARDLERLEHSYRERKAQIRADSSLSWEKKELAVRRLGKEYDRERKQAERGAA
jgi:hypothetical protein